MTKMGQMLYKEKEINKIFAQIAGVPDPQTRIAIPGTGIAEPGDLLFFITHHPVKPPQDNNKPKSILGLAIKPLEPLFKKWYGFEKNDFDKWHVGIYFMGRKRKHHQRINLWMLHSQPPTLREKGGVHIQQLSSAALVKKSPASQTRMEILQFKGISKEQRKIITDFASSMVGCKFDDFFFRHAKLTWALGFPNLLRHQKAFSCQGLVISSYSAAGIYFPHPYKSFPLCNIGRFLGNPLGNPKDRVNPKYSYLMDHHIYRDPRFEIKVAVHHSLNTNEFHLETGNLEKYSWNKPLRNKYLSAHVLHS
jgi:hypothetical protein